jgi:hypothetical protein
MPVALTKARAAHRRRVITRISKMAMAAVAPVRFLVRMVLGRVQKVMSASTTAPLVVAVGHGAERLVAQKVPVHPHDAQVHRTAASPG